MDIDVNALQTLMAQAAGAVDIVQGFTAELPGETPPISCELCRCDFN